MKIDEFVRIYPLRAPNLMWFLGAGASAASGIKTAWDMIWEFKRAIYCASSKSPQNAFSDFADPAIRLRLQRFFDEKGDYPTENHEDEYAFYFEKAYSSEADRRRYIEKLVLDGTPSFGHLVLSVLLKCDKARIVWTTNFDSMIEDACIPLLGSSGKIVIADLGEPEKLLQAMNEGRWPIVGKIHGDFRSQKLKNTKDELRHQDEQLRHALVEGCKRYGMAVVGYSGRDHSVMQALDNAISDGNGFPFGLFWFHRSDANILPSVKNLINKASRSGIDAHLIEVETFDELMADTYIQFTDLPDDVTKRLKDNRTRVSDAPLLKPIGTWPIIRLNALPIVESPTVCRRIVCTIGGIKEVRQAVIDSQLDIIASRREVGVIAFGKDKDINETFGGYNIKNMDIHVIENSRLRYNSAELSIIYESICRGITRNQPLKYVFRRSGHIIVVDNNFQYSELFRKLRNAVSKICGTVPQTQIQWAEAIRVRVEYRMNRLWLLIEPTIWTELNRDTDENDALKVKEYVREKLATRYNKTWNGLLEGWMEVIVGQGSEREIYALGINEGIDARFKILKKTAFSWRGNND